MKCSFDGCSLKSAAFSYCDGHYRQLKSGRELKPLKGKNGENYFTIESLLERTTKQGDCRVWDGCKVSGGYGQVRSDGKQVRAHRLAYELATGVDPGRQVVHHKCANRPCINPEHLELASQADNLLEMMARKSLEARIAELEDRVAYLEAQLDTQRSVA